MKRLPLLLALAGLAVLPARAAAAPATHDYLAAGAIDYHQLIPPPPPDDSVLGRADEEMAAQLDAHRTPDQTALAKHYEKFSVFILLKDVLGPECTPENLPRTAAFFHQALAESRPIVDDAKSEWNRKRPYVFNPALRPAVDKPDNASYPSGHAYSSSLDAVLLAAALPERADDWMKAAALVRWSRLVGGAHYPNDVTTGQILGEAVAREMLKSPKLQQALAEVRAEITERIIKTVSPQNTQHIVEAASPFSKEQPQSRPHLSSTSLNRNSTLTNSASGITNLGIVGIDARWSKYGEYMHELIDIVQAQWYRILKINHVSPPHGSHVVVTFRLTAMGETSIIKIEDSDAGKQGVISCESAITDPQPYRKWPDQMIAVLGNSQELTFSFYYQ